MEKPILKLNAGGGPRFFCAVKYVGLDGIIKYFLGNEIYTIV